MQSNVKLSGTKGFIDYLFNILKISPLTNFVSNLKRKLKEYQRYSYLSTICAEISKVFEIFLISVLQLFLLSSCAIGENPAQNSDTKFSISSKVTFIATLNLKWQINPVKPEGK